MARSNSSGAAIKTTSQADFSILPTLSLRYDKVSRSMGFDARDTAGWRRWRRDLIKRLKQLTGYDTMVRAPLRPRITEVVELEDHTRQRIEIQTEPGVVMTLYALVPKGLEGRAPAVICPHGHGSGGKYSPAGRTDIPEIAEQVRLYNYDYGVQYCRPGFVAFCPDARGFGERQEASVKREEAAKASAGGKPDILRQSCQYLNQMGYPLGQTVTGMWAWDLHRLVDYIQTRGDCDPKRIGCAGLSGGGLQTLWATALDERIGCAVVSGYFYGFKQSLLEMHWNCSCNYVPHLYETVDVGDLGALIAPRPLLIETGSRDPLNGAAGMGNVLPQVRLTRKAYKLLGANDRLAHDVFDGEHLWHGVEAVPWMKRWLGDDH